jgi:hypothetical protein
VISQIATSPVVVFCQRMSPLPSPLKSAVSAIGHTAGTLPTPGRVTWAPFKDRIATLPLMSRHSRSASPSPSKSRYPTIVQTIESAAADACGLNDLRAPFMSHTAALPPVPRHAMALLPSIEVAGMGGCSA